MTAIHEVLIKSVRYSCYIALPITLLLVVFGGAIMELWMGPRYGDGWLPAILAAGFLVTMVQTPVWPILVGLNAHGRPGIAELLASLCSAMLVFLGLHLFNWGLPAIAVGVSVPLAIMNGVYLPVLMRRRINLGIGRYLRAVAVAPIIRTLPFAGCLVVARLVWGDKPLIGLVVGGAIGSVVLAAMYWRYVFPDTLKDWVTRYVHRMLRLMRLVSSADAVA